MPGETRSTSAVIGSAEARDHFAELLGRVGFAKERIVITRNGQEMGAFIPMDDYEQLLQEEQDAASADGASGGKPPPRPRP